MSRPKPTTARKISLGVMAAALLSPPAPAQTAPTAEDTAVDGSPVRDPAIWVPLHTVYWNALLEPFGLTVSDDMPFWVEAFELLYDADAGRSA